MIRQISGVRVTGAKGRTDSFEVSVNDQLIFSKLETGMFPVPEQVMEKVKQMVHGGEAKKPSKLVHQQNKCIHH